MTNAELAAEGAEWCVSCPKCYPGRVAEPCGAVHDCPECAEQRSALVGAEADEGAPLLLTAGEAAQMEAAIEEAEGADG